MAGSENEDCDIGNLLDDLLANDNESETEDEPPKKVLKELDFNFLDVVHESEIGILDKKVEDGKNLLCKNDDSSDDEDQKYFHEQKYSEAGRNIKQLLKEKELHQEELSLKRKFSTQESLITEDKVFNWNDVKKEIKDDTFLQSPKSVVKQSTKAKDKTKTGPLAGWLNKPSDIYTDPIFGLRIVTPLISSTELKEKMKDRTAVTVSRVKNFISTQSMDNDWVIAGVLIRKITRKSQNGNVYCIWTITDLSDNLNTVSVFLFKNAYKLFWKAPEGVVVGILNPNVMESRNEKDQATLSVDVAQKVMILGTSKDMGKCKSKKKNGDSCTNIVNISKCEYCIFHVKQEYNKASRRSDLQTDTNNRKFGNSFGAKPKNNAPGIYSQGNHQNMLVIPAKRNLKMEQKDSERLAMLMGKTASSEKCSNDITQGEPKNKAFMVELSSEQVKKDLGRLDKIRGWSSAKTLVGSSSDSDMSLVGSSLRPTSTAVEQEKKSNSSLSGFSVPRLGFGLKGDTIDFSVPIPKKRITTAKMNAINWVKEKGGIKQSNPNKIKESRKKIEATSKRRREDDEKETMPKPKKINAMSDKFKELLAVNSAHIDLIEKSQEVEEEKYFNILEAKEKMEEKMLNTFKVECKAVKCLVCRYTAFSASELCREKKHPLRVIDAMKSFFKCSDCGNRTVSLDRMPSLSCKKCKSSNWMRTAMMDERKMSLPGATLSIRGGEQKFIGSDIKNTSLDLIMPEPDD